MVPPIFSVSVRWTLLDFLITSAQLLFAQTLLNGTTSVMADLIIIYALMKLSLDKMHCNF